DWDCPALERTFTSSWRCIIIPYRVGRWAGPAKEMGVTKCLKQGRKSLKRPPNGVKTRQTEPSFAKKRPFFRGSALKTKSCDYVMAMSQAKLVRIKTYGR